MMATTSLRDSSEYPMEKQSTSANLEQDEQKRRSELGSEAELQLISQFVQSLLGEDDHTLTRAQWLLKRMRGMLKKVHPECLVITHCVVEDKSSSSPLADVLELSVSRGGGSSSETERLKDTHKHGSPGSMLPTTGAGNSEDYHSQNVVRKNKPDTVHSTTLEPEQVAVRVETPLPSKVEDGNLMEDVMVHDKSAADNLHSRTVDQPQRDIERARSDEDLRTHRSADGSGSTAAAVEQGVGDIKADSKQDDIGLLELNDACKSCLEDAAAELEDSVVANAENWRSMLHQYSAGILDIVRDDVAAKRVHQAGRPRKVKDPLDRWRSSIPNFRAMYHFMNHEVFCAEGLRRYYDCVDRQLHHQGNPESENNEDNGKELVAVNNVGSQVEMPDSLEQFLEAWRSSYCSHIESTIATREVLLNSAVFFREWSRICPLIKPGGSLAEYLLNYSKERGRSLGKGKGRLTLLWDWLIDHAYPQCAITSAKVRKTLRNCLRDDIQAGRQLYQIAEFLPNAIFMLLPSNTGSIARRWPKDDWGTFLRIFSESVPVTERLCEFMHREMDPPGSQPAAQLRCYSNSGANLDVWFQNVLGSSSFFGGGISNVEGADDGAMDVGMVVRSRESSVESEDTIEAFFA